ncbi:MAG: TfoX/Sxy family protein [Clostridiales bacterium]|nr:TfoX/Sxy family protein [Clostridiales bacterium]
MGKANFNPEIRGVVESFLLKIPLAVPGKMFGYPAYYVNKKLFACIYEEGVGIKVPLAMANDLIGRKDIVPFIPMGRHRMKEWIQINHLKPEDYLNDKDIFEASINYVATL